MKERDGEEGVEVQYLPCYLRFCDDFTKIPLCPLLPPPVLRGLQGQEERTQDKKAVPSPTSPLLHNTPNAGSGLRYAVVLHG